jgi:hypothetical protein
VGRDVETVRRVDGNALGRLSSDRLHGDDGSRRRVLGSGVVHGRLAGESERLDIRGQDHARVVRRLASGLLATARVRGLLCPDAGGSAQGLHEEGNIFGELLRDRAVLDGVVDTAHAAVGVQNALQ